MEANCILLKYGELFLKGKNRRQFLNSLLENLKERFKSYPVEIKCSLGRIIIYLNGVSYDEIAFKLRRVFGLVGFSKAFCIANDIEEIRKAVFKVVESNLLKKTFKIVTKRANKKFPLSSMEVNVVIGGAVRKNFKLSVDVHKPELTIFIEIREEFSYVYAAIEKGLAGLPVGVSGKVLLLLSGGIDSPVAGYLSLKRGTKIACLHFHSYPYTSLKAKQKVISICKKLANYAGEFPLFFVSLAKLQKFLNENCFKSYLITLLRRSMFQIAEKLAKKYGFLALVTGENLGQVASQTLESLNVINEAVNMLVLRPLICFDKVDIVNIAKDIGTYEKSILPYEDCCTLFTPKNPITKPSLAKCLNLERRLSLNSLIEEAVAEIEIIQISPYN